MTAGGEGEGGREKEKERGFVKVCKAELINDVWWKLPKASF